MATHPIPAQTVELIPEAEGRDSLTVAVDGWGSWTIKAVEGGLRLSLAAPWKIRPPEIFVHPEWTGLTVMIEKKRGKK